MPALPRRRLPAETFIRSEQQLWKPVVETALRARLQDASTVFARQCRAYFYELDMPHRDQTAWLWMQPGSNRSPPQNSLLAGKRTGNFAESGPPEPTFAPSRPANSVACSKIS